MVVKLDDLVAEHLDHLHYMNDILLLQIDDLNGILTDHLLNRLLIPLYMYSLVGEASAVAASSPSQPPRPRISHIISLFLLSQVFLIVSYDPLVQSLVNIILTADMTIFEKPQFAAPPETLEESLYQVARASNSSSVDGDEEAVNEDRSSTEVVREEAINESSAGTSEAVMEEAKESNGDVAEASQDEKEVPETIVKINASNITDEEKAAAALKSSNNELDNERPFLDSLFSSLDCTHKLDDHTFIFAICLIYAMVHNQGTNLTEGLAARAFCSTFAPPRCYTLCITARLQFGKTFKCLLSHSLNAAVHYTPGLRNSL